MADNLIPIMGEKHWLWWFEKHRYLRETHVGRVAELGESYVSFKLQYFLCMDFPAGNYRSTAFVSYQSGHTLWAQKGSASEGGALYS